jgi:hypothetical protein
MTEPLASNDADAQKRRSTRIAQAVPTTVTGVDALGQPFKERTTTVQVNCHGCKYQSKHYVPKNSVVTLEVPHTDPSRPPRSIVGRVIWVQRPRTVRELFQIGLEFETAGNIWGIAFPPEDWFPYPDAEAPAAAVSSPAAPAHTESVSFPEIEVVVDEAPAANVPPAAHVPVAAAPVKAAPPAPVEAKPATPADSKIHLVPAQQASVDTQAAAKQMSQMLAEAKVTIEKTARKDAQAAITDEMTIVRQQLDALLHEAVEHAIKTSMDRVSESASKKVIQQAADKTAAIVEEARKNTEANAVQIDAKVRDAVASTVTIAVQQAAEQAAQQAASQKLQSAVEATVERVIAEREATSPSLKILSSPEAAQEHLDQWRKNIEQTAQDVQSGTIQRTQAEAEAAANRWKQEFDSTVRNASSAVNDSVAQAAQTAVSQAKESLGVEAAQVRSSMAEAIADAHAQIESLGANIKEHTARAEQVQADAAIVAQRLKEECERSVSDASLQLQARLANVSQTISAQADQIQNNTAAAIERFTSERDRAVSGAVEQLKATVADASQSIAAQTQQAQTEAAATVERLKAERENALSGVVAELQATLAETSKTITSQAQQAQADAAVAAERLRADRDRLISDAAAQVQSRLADSSQAAIAQAEQEIAGKAAQLRSFLEESFASSEAEARETVSALEQERARAEQARDSLTDTSASTMEQARVNLDEMLRAHAQNAALQADQIVAERTALVTPALEEATQAALAHFGTEMDQTLNLKLGLARQAASDLAQAEQQAAEARRAIEMRAGEMSAQASQLAAQTSEQIRQSSESAIASALSRLQEHTANIPSEIEQVSLAALSTAEAEIEKKSTEAQHETYEALSKAADWYQKKAQTTMQSTLEKSVEQAASNLRDRAAEVSSLVTAEMDHHRRTYAAHSQAEMEETAKDIVERERARLSETAAMTNASFSDQVHQAAAESLRKFQEASRQAIEKARSDMEFNREGSLVEFQKALDRRMTEGVEQAHIFLESQLAPLVETWEAKRQAQQREWIDLLKRSTEESMDQYKARLDNASNAWLLASATTLGQNSQVVLDTLAKSAEKRLRDTCAQVLAGMGDTLKDRLLGISMNFSADPDDDAPPEKK